MRAKSRATGKLADQVKIKKAKSAAFGNDDWPS
jgi:hypothetical protein